MAGCQTWPRHRALQGRSCSEVTLRLRDRLVARPLQGRFETRTAARSSTRYTQSRTGSRPTGPTCCLRRSRTSRWRSTTTSPSCRRSAKLSGGLTRTRAVTTTSSRSPRRKHVRQRHQQGLQHRRLRVRHRRRLEEAFGLCS